MPSSSAVLRQHQLLARRKRRVRRWCQSVDAPTPTMGERDKPTSKNSQANPPAKSGRVLQQNPPESGQIGRHLGMSALCSELARLFFTFAGWSVQPCVRPVRAVHMTAGHNAFRGSGPGQKPAFDNALAQVGCPDRRIGRLCITCCSPSQPSHHAGCRRDPGHAASATGSL